MCENPMECYLYRIIQVGNDACQIIQLFIWGGGGGGGGGGGVESIKYSKGINKKNNFLVDLVKVG